MRRFGKILVWTFGILLGLPVVLAGVVLIVANIGPGRRLIERETARLTGGQVVLAGLDGRFPDALRLGHAELRDADGVWLALDDVTLNWSPLALMRGEAHLRALSARRIAVPRLPVAAPSAAAPGQAAGQGGGFTLPVRVVLDKLVVGRFEIGAPVAGVAATLGLAGDARLASMQEGAASLVATRLDSPGRYAVSGRVDPGHVTARIEADEPAHGLVSGIAQLPDLGALSLRASLDGPRTAEALELALTAGEARAGAHGSVDLDHAAAALDLTAEAPRMAPRPDVAWQSVAMTAHVEGPWLTPAARAHVAIAGLAAGGADLTQLQADMEGDRGAVALRAALTGLRLPGPKPDLLAADPVRLTAAMRLDQAARPVDFALLHPLLRLSGHAETGGAIRGEATATVPDVAPFGALAGIALQGHTTATAHVAEQGATMRIAIDGTAGITGGMAPVPGLIGPDARFSARAALTGQDIDVSSAEVNGRTLHVSAHGFDHGTALDLAWQVGLTDLSVLAPSLLGKLDIVGRAHGKRTDLALEADASGEVGGKGFPRGPVAVSVRAAGLPGAPNGTVEAHGTLDGAKLTLDAALDRRPDGGLHTVLRRLDWKSAHGVADLTLPAGARLPLGTLDLGMTRLADLQPLTGQALTGSAKAAIVTEERGGRPLARIDLHVRDAGLAGNRIGRLDLTGTVADPAANPDAALRLTADGIAAAGVTGSARVEANGKQDALALRLTTALHGLAGADASLSAAARLDAVGKRVDLGALQAAWKGETLRLLAPARVGFGPAVTVDRLRLGLGRATLALAGRLSPTLDLTASAANVTPDLARPFVPDLQADGTLGLDARLTGTPAAPQGSVKLAARGMHLRSGPGAAIAPATLLANADLAGRQARLDARLTAGPRIHLAATGTVPLDRTGALALRANGALDLTVLNPILLAEGRRVRGMLTLDLAASGSAAAPRLDGTMRLADGEVQDYARGVHLTGMTALVQAAGDTVRLTDFTAQAGPGTLKASGTAGVFAPGMPVDLRLTAHQARPLASDLLTATLDADLTLRGQAATRLDAGGHVLVRRANINIPDSFPPSVAVLDVRQPGQKPPPPASPGPVIGLDLTVDAPGQIFVRGHGLDAELGGRLHAGGTAAAPQISGGFDLRRGAFSLAGTTLKFTRGRVGFNGTGVTGKIDPTLDFQADSTSGNVTATLKVTGYADAPKIGLSSSPELPQDEVLAHLLFGQSVKQLSPFQIAEIAAAIAELSGVTGGGPGLLGSVQQTLGLDRLSVGGGSSGSSAGATVEAGRYVARGVYVGARQGTAGNTQAQVQVDLTRRLKLQTTLGSGGGTAQGATPENDPGSSVGLSYQFEY